MAGILLIREEFTAVEQYNASVFLIAKKRWTKRALTISIVPVIIYFLSVSLNSKYLPFPPSVIFLPVSVFLLLFVFPFFIAVIQMLLVPGKFKNVMLSFSDKGFSRAGNGFEYKKNWEEFTGWEETNNFIYLYFSEFDGVAHIVQKRLVSESELRLLRELLQKHLG